jgi:hypothetical protein
MKLSKQIFSSRSFRLLGSVMILGSMASAAIVGCSEDEKNTQQGSPEALKAACEASCDKQSSATGCDPNQAELCKSLGCALVVAIGSQSACLAPLTAYYECSAKQEYVCEGTNKEPKLKDSSACAAESEAIKPCVGTSGAGGSSGMGGGAGQGGSAGFAGMAGTAGVAGMAGTAGSAGTAGGNTSGSGGSGGSAGGTNGAGN